VNKTTLGLRIREARQAKGFSRQILAEKVGTGEVYLGEIERGIKVPSLSTFIRIVDALDLSADYLLRDELPSGKEYVLNEITQKLQHLTPKQRKTAADILDAYLRNLD
jgi:transcriptional regulator with XRE-family HTH domain